MSALIDALLIAAVVTNGLLAGLFFAFVCAIAPGFRQLDDATYVQAFRVINRAIMNGWFLLVFFAAPVTAVIVAVLSLQQTPPTSSLWTGLGALCAVLTVLITAAGNVPLNNRLDRATTGTRSQSLARQGFENRWNRWNLARAFTSAGALASLTTFGALG